MSFASFHNDNEGDMRKLALAFAAAGALMMGALSGTAQAAPASGLGAAVDTLGLVEQTQYVYGGYRHCWYGSGWKGPGWYRCGYRWRNGYGWGGPVGWNGWAAPGVVVGAPGVVVVAPRRYYYGGRYWNGRRWHGGRWVYY
jgi:hypothetical protein